MLAEKNIISPIVNAKITSKCALFVSNMLDIPVECIIMMALKIEGQNLNSFSVAKLKDIIRHLKSHYIECQNLSLSYNKPQLVNSIENIITSEINQKLILSEINYMNSSKVNIGIDISGSNSKVNMNININENKSSTTNVISKKVGLKSINNYSASLVNIETQQKHSMISNKIPSNPSENKHINSTSSTSITNIHNNKNLNVVLDSVHQKQQIYLELASYQGITKEEILSEISHVFKTTTLPNHYINSDMVLLSIIEKRQTPIIDAAERQRQLNEQENKDLDFAIRESEKERDVIQERKRQRVTELKESKEVLFIDANEYKSSILLSSDTLQNHLSSETASGSNSHNSSSNSGIKLAAYKCISLASTSSSSLYLNLISNQSSKSDEGVGFNIEKDALISGSSLVRFIVLMLDLITKNSPPVQSRYCIDGNIDSVTIAHQLLSNNNNNNNNVKLIPWNESSGTLYQLELLRVIVTNLLLLESDAIKFYPKMSIPYIFTMAKRIDMKLIKSTLQEALLTSNYVSTSKKQPTNNNTNKATCANVIERETCRLQRGLYKFPEEGKLVPAIFRSSKFSLITNLLHKNHNNNGDIDDDDIVEVLVDPSVIASTILSHVVVGTYDNDYCDYYHSDTSSNQSSCDYDDDDD